MLGDSAGRSSGHRIGSEARRKNTERERQKIDPPRDLMEPAFRLTARGKRLRDNIVVWGSIFALGILGGYLVAWWTLF